MNGFSGLPFAPSDPILLTTAITTYPNGDVTLEGGSRSSYPALEVWTYQAGQDPSMILNMPQTTPDQLGSFNQTIPSVDFYSLDEGDFGTSLDPNSVYDGYDGYGGDPYADTLG